MGTFDKRNWAENANGIGDWLGVMEFMSIVAIPMNIAICYFTKPPEALANAKNLEEFGPNAPESQSRIVESLMGNDKIGTLTKAILFVILIEHVLIVFKIFLQGLIPDVPEEVYNTEYLRRLQTKQAQSELSKIKSKGKYQTYDEIVARLQNKIDDEVEAIQEAEKKG